MTTAPPRRPQNGSTSSLIEHDIHLTREGSTQGGAQVLASVECERTGCAMRVETCARCPHFARIETHEAGYVLLCRAIDATEPVKTERS